MDISVFMKVTIRCIASGVNSGEPLLLVTGIFSAYLLLVFKNLTESERSSTLNCDYLSQKNKIGCFFFLVDCEQSLFFFRFSKGSVERRSRETRETRAAPLPSRAFSHARGHLLVSGVLLDGPRKKRDCSSRETLKVIRVFFI